jgi:hypothetical protein
MPYSDTHILLVEYIFAKLVRHFCRASGKNVPLNYKLKVMAPARMMNYVNALRVVDTDDELLQFAGSIAWQMREWRSRP